MSNVVRVQNLGQILKEIKPTFDELAKVHNTVDHRREASFALEILENNEYLRSVAIKNQDSFRRAVINVAAIGLSLNPAMGLAYLLPRKNRVCLDISYRGLIAIAVDIGSIKWAMADIVREKDEFTYNGPGEKPLHKFNPFDEDRGEIIGAFCLTKMCSDEVLTTPMAIKEIYEIRGRSESYKSSKGSPWLTDEKEMIKKTLIRRASKMWPKAATDRRFTEAADVDRESDVISAPVELNTEKRKKQFRQISEMLLILNIDEEYYLTEKLPNIVRRKISCITELTDIEIDQIIVQLSQLVEERPKNENPT